MQGNAVTFLALAIKGDRSDSESAPVSWWRGPHLPLLIQRWRGPHLPLLTSGFLMSPAGMVSEAVPDAGTGSQPQGKQQGALISTIGLLAHK